MVKSVAIKLLILLSGLIIIFALRNNRYSDTRDLFSVKDISAEYNEEEVRQKEPKTDNHKYQPERVYNNLPGGWKNSCLEGVININEAEKGQFVLLPGIGEKLADEIIGYRKDNGGYKAIDEIMNVKGIKEKKYSGIARYLAVSGKTTLRHCGAK